MRKIKIRADGSVEIHHDDMPQHFDDGGTVLGGPTSGGTVSSSQNPNNGILGSIGGSLGLNNNFTAGAANIQAGTNAAQLNNAYTGAQQGLSQQQALASALQPGGISAANSQQGLLSALQSQAAGGGPNPAQAQLAQNTQTNVANQAALMAGQRGASSNVGLMAREAGQQGAATQQQAVGQAATLQAQQQLAAQQNLAAQQQAMISGAGQTAAGVSQGQQSEQNILQNANTSYNNAGVGMQQNINNANASSAAANQNMAGNIFGGALSGLSSSGAMASMFAKGGVVSKNIKPVPDHMKAMHAIYHPKRLAEGGEVSDSSGEPASSPAVQDTENTGSFSPVSSSASSGPGGGGSASLPADQTDFASAMKGSSGGGGGGAAGIAALAAMAKGGRVKKMASGGAVDYGVFSPVSSSASSGPGGGGSVSLPGASTDLGKDAKQQKGQSQSGQQSAQGQSVAGGPMDNNAGPDKFFNPGDAAGNGATSVAAKGGKIPGKPKVNHDSYSNDNVKALLSPGEVVIPLHVMNSNDPVNGAAKFVAAIIAKGGHSKGKEEDDFKEALKSAIKSRKK